MKMPRRDWLKLAGAAGIASALPSASTGAADTPQPAQISVELKKGHGLKVLS